jgi:RIO kinase 1
MLERFSKEADRLKIYQGVFDDYTFRTLIDLASKGYFNTLDYPISTGKEADVYRATMKDHTHRAIKIYRVETSNFRHMYNYLAGDIRFSNIKKNKRSVIAAWCQKEYRNLRDMHEAGIGVPFPYKFSNNVLIMEFIGEGGVAAHMLTKHKPKQPKKLIKTLALYIKNMYQRAGLVHGDFSEFNIMMIGERPYLIDVSQAMKVGHVIAKQLLRRDIHNLARLAKKLKVDFDEEKLYDSIV